MAALGPHRRAGQQRRSRSARADPRDQRRAMAHRARRLSDERRSVRRGWSRRSWCSRRRARSSTSRPPGRSSRARCSRPRPCSAPGLPSYTKIFADTYAADNVRMNNVLPGWIDSLPETEERRDSVPMQRYGTSRGDRRDRRVPGVGGGRLYHRPEYPRRWRVDALDLTAIYAHRDVTVTRCAAGGCRVARFRRSSGPCSAAPDYRRRPAGTRSSRHAAGRRSAAGSLCGCPS